MCTPSMNKSTIWQTVSTDFILDNIFAAIESLLDAIASSTHEYQRDCNVRHAITHVGRLRKQLHESRHQCDPASSSGHANICKLHTDHPEVFKWICVYIVRLQKKRPIRKDFYLLWIGDLVSKCILVELNLGVLFVDLNVMIYTCYCLYFSYYVQSNPRAPPGVLLCEACTLNPTQSMSLSAIINDT